jgi:hypothetical protein
VIDPLDGPWAVRRNRARGPSDLNPGPDLEMIARADARYGVVGASVSGMNGATGATTLTTPTAPTASRPPTAPDAGKSRSASVGILRDVLDRAGKVARPGKPVGKPSRPDSRRPAKQRRYSAKVAGPVRLGLVLVAVVLVTLIVKLAGFGFNTATGTTALTSPLAFPAPAEAGGLPRHYQPEQNLSTIALINEFTKRFSALSGNDSGQPSALYREPGAIDPETDQPGWVMYLGYNASSDLGSPATAVTRLMAALTGASGSSWTASPGQLGGRARCALTSMSGTTVTFCAWATDRTYGALMSPTSDTRGQELATLMPLMRIDLQS